MIRLGPVHFIDRRAILQHDDAVGDLEDLVETVRDVDDDRAALLQRLDALEEKPALARGEHAGWLVENEQRRLVNQRLGDFEHLLERNGVRPRRPPNIDVFHADGRELSRCFGVGSTPVDLAMPRRHRAELQILRDGELGEEAQLLVDGANAERECVRRILDDGRNAVDQ